MSENDIPRSSSSRPGVSSSLAPWSRDPDRRSSHREPSPVGHERNGHNGGTSHQERHSSQDTRLTSDSPSSITMSHPEHDEEQGIKVSKTRKSGGFLLSSAFRSSPEARQKKVDLKGKRKADSQPLNAAKRSSRYRNSHLNGSMRSSPLAQVVVSPRAPQWDGTSSRASSEVDSATANGTRSSREDRGRSGESGRDSSGDYGQEAPQPSGSIDPAQIVNMALNLSESRRRNFSAGHLLPPPSAGARRAVSATIPAPSTMLQGSYQAYGAGGSLRHHLQQQRRISRNHSPGSALKTPNSRHASSASAYASPNMDTSGGTLYHFSDATLARAEKARQYIELSVEYRRLLQYLPPLKPDAAAFGNSTFTTTSIAGTNNVQLTKSPTSSGNQKHALGRLYNPIQLIRNRKLRARTRNSLNPDVESWHSAASVTEWIDNVEQASRDPKYRGVDIVALPPYPLDGPHLPVDTVQENSPGHHRTQTPVNTPKSRRMDWFTSPSEHLADAYWLEQGRNKSLIENKHANRIFPDMPAADLLQPRTSFESRKSRPGSLAPSAASYENPASDGESYKDGQRGRKHHFLGHNRDDSRGRFKTAWQRARGRSRSTLSTRSSSDDDISVTDKGRKMDSLGPDDSNVGPLERHMKNMLNAEAESPTLLSPGTPNKWGLRTTNEPMSRATAHPETEGPKTGLHTDVVDFSPRDPVKNGLVNQNQDSVVPSIEPRSSFEDSPNSARSNSPAVGPVNHNISLEASPAPSRAISPTRKSKLSMLPFVRADGHRDVRKHDGDGMLAEYSDAKSSRQTSAEVPSKPRTGSEAATSPNRAKEKFFHKNNDSLNNLSPRPSSRGKDTNDTREPESAVRRFFKGGRIGEIVRHESSKVGSSFKKRDSPQEASPGDITASDTDTMDESDTDTTDLATPFKSRPHALQRESSATIGSRRFLRSDKHRYNLDNLPSFRPAKSLNQPTPAPGHDHITKQQRAVKQNRSPRFDQLAPPNLDLSRVSTAADVDSSDVSRISTHLTPDTARDEQEDREARRRSYGFPPLSRHASRLGSRLTAILDKPGGVGRGGLPVSSLTELDEQNKARPSLSDKRHWSISDKPRSRSPHSTASSSINPADIARVRALLLCSGIKAAHIQRRAYQPRDSPPRFLREAAKTSGAELRAVPRKEEHVLAARMLTTSLENETSALHSHATQFRENTIKNLTNNLSELKDIVSASVERARNTGDESVRFGAEIAGQRTIEIRRVVDALEKLARTRRRRLRWVRRVGFGMVEWGVVLFMWWIWLIVVCLRMVLNVFKGIGRTVKWVFWL